MQKRGETMRLLPASARGFPCFFAMQLPALSPRTYIQMYSDTRRMPEQEIQRMKEKREMKETRTGMELNMEEMNDIAGGAFKKPAEKAGYRIYQIQANDTLIRIANKFGIKSYKEILKWNPKITNPNLIRTGDYLYIKK